MVPFTGNDLLGKLPGSLLPGAQSIVFKSLTVDDHAACCAVEDSAFTNPEHRASPEKFSYRLLKCSNISYGIFGRPEQEPQPGSLTSKINADRIGALSTEDKTGNLVLLTHIVSTMGTGPIVTDKDMAYPQNWRDFEANKGSPLGHQEDGRTVCLHSLAVIPEVQGTGLGKLIVSAYLRAMRESGLCDRIALLCQDYLVRFYEKCGFQSLGESGAEFGGGGWYNMVVDFPKATTAESH